MLLKKVRVLMTYVHICKRLVRLWPGLSAAVEFREVRPAGDQPGQGVFGCYWWRLAVVAACALRARAGTS
jgi:hypothetical protein